MHRATVVAVVLFVVVAVFGASISPAAGEAPGAESVTYIPPVDAQLVDTFRPPATPYGPGNRGVDYATEEGQAVTASAAGEVVFAGRVGTSLHVVVLHADGIRTSYSFLATTTVRRGDRVGQGDQVGSAGSTSLHVGARAPSSNEEDVYLDPLVLFGQRPGEVHLVDDPDPSRPLTEVEERRDLTAGLRGTARFVRAGARWVTDRAARAIKEKVDLAMVLASDLATLAVPLPVHLAVAALAWDEQQRGCTPVGTPRPPPPTERRIAVLVGGLGSATGQAAVLRVDTLALGYEAADVHQFSYRADGRPYRPADTEGDIAAAGARLRKQIATLRRDNPGVPIDVFAHSQGGLVARVAITSDAESGNTGEPHDVAVLVTLGTPHLGANLATAEAGLQGSKSGQAALDLAGVARIGGIDPTAVSIEQMAETSDFLHDLRARTWPASTRVLSIAARADPAVPNALSRLEGAANAVVTPDGRSTPADHDRLPGSPETTQEIARSLAGQGPTCRSFLDAMIDEAIARELNVVQDAIGAGVTAGGLYIDARTKQAIRSRRR